MFVWYPRKTLKTSNKLCLGAATAASLLMRLWPLSMIILMIQQWQKTTLKLSEDMMTKMGLDIVEKVALMMFHTQ